MNKFQSNLNLTLYSIDSTLKLEDKIIMAKTYYKIIKTKLENFYYSQSIIAHIERKLTDSERYKLSVINKEISSLTDKKRVLETLLFSFKSLEKLSNEDTNTYKNNLIENYNLLMK